MDLSKDYYVIIKYAPETVCHRCTAGSESGCSFVGVCGRITVFACKKCVFAFLSNRHMSAKTPGHKPITLWFPFPLSFSFQAKSVYCNGFGICGQGYRQMGVHLPACSTSHGTNVTTQRAFGFLSTTEKSHWHGWIDLIQMGVQCYSCIRRPWLH